MQHNGLIIMNIEEDMLTPLQKQNIAHLTKSCFSHIPKGEIEEDFYSPKIARVLAYQNDSLVGYAGIHLSLGNFQGRDIHIGGFGGVCTRRDKRRKGIASLVCKQAVAYLMHKQCDVLFISVDTTHKSYELYEKLGFVHLLQEFSWTNTKNQVKKDTGGMIAPLKDTKLFHLIQKNNDILHIGKGYW